MKIEFIWRREVLTSVLLVEVVSVGAFLWLFPSLPPPPPPDVLPYLGVVISSFIATPSTIAFSSPNPDTTASSTATVNISLTSANQHAWNMSVHSGASTLTNCGTVPVSAITVTCTTFSSGGTGSHAPTGSCGSPTILSTTPTQIISGIQGDQSDTYTIGLNYTFTDSWNYPGASSPACTLVLTYTLTLST